MKIDPPTVVRENRIHLWVEFGETREDALKRAMKQLKITDEQLKDYTVIYIGDGTYKPGQFRS